VNLGSKISMVIPCRNESGNISHIIARLEKFESIHDFIFVEGGSSDNTYEELVMQLERVDNFNISLVRQTGKGKFNAVLEGAQCALTEHIAIWDSDMSIDFFDQNLMINAYIHNDGTEKFVTANRLNPQMHNTAMRKLNKVGNHVFAFLVRANLGINVPDALAGTKIFPRRIILEGAPCARALSLDPFGDLYLLSKIRQNNLKFVTLNCEYKPRIFGTTNIARWSGGFAMLRFLIHLRLHECNKVKNSQGN
jgi:glycosyltransferase involved in cell wall biosynthesis